MAFWLVVKPAPYETIVAVEDWGEAAATAITPIAFFVMTHLVERRYHIRLTRVQRIVSTCLVLGTFTYALGEYIWTYFEEVTHQTPFPSMADAAYLAAYPLLLVAILFLPARPLFASKRIRIVLDSLMIMVAIVTVSWYFILGPTILAGDESLLAKIIGSAYPLADLVLVFCTLLIIYRAPDPRMRQPTYLLAFALTLIILGDSIFDYLSLNNTYTTGTILDISWTIGYMLIVIVALQMWAIWLSDALAGAPAPSVTFAPPSKPIDHILHAALPYVVVPLIAILIAYTIRTHGDEQYEGGVYVGSAVLLILIFLRQIFAIRETIMQNQQMQLLNQTLQSMQQGLLDEQENLMSANSKLATLATTDPLTNLPNHRAIVDVLDRELDRASRHQQHCAVFFMDLDHFKSINDSYGHPAGDTVLREFSYVVRQILRKYDTLGRWGGEEFVAIIPEMDFDDLQQLAERVRAAVAEHLFPIGAGIHLTCSLGIAQFASDALERDSLVQAADQAMYAAKKLGRNQVRTFRDPLVAGLAQTMKTAKSREAEEMAGTVAALTKLMEWRDAASVARTQAITIIAVTIAQMLGVDHRTLEKVEVTAQLSDIGKIVLPDALLHKSTPLSAEEKNFLCQHPVIGAEVFDLIPTLHDLAPGLRAHHEWWDGRGYPDGLAGEAIPLVARIVSVAEVYTEMVYEDGTQASQNLAYCVAELQRRAGKQLDPQVTHKLISCLTTQTTSAKAA